MPGAGWWWQGMRGVAEHEVGGRLGGLGSEPKLPLRTKY